MCRHWGVPSNFIGKNLMSAHRAANLSKRRRNSQPVPVLDWPSSLFTEVQLIDGDDLIDDVLSMPNRPHAAGWTPRHDHAGVAL
jgi:hypothetical protein